MLACMYMHGCKHVAIFRNLRSDNMCAHKHAVYYACTRFRPNSTILWISSVCSVASSSRGSNNSGKKVADLDTVLGSCRVWARHIITFSVIEWEQVQTRLLKGQSQGLETSDDVTEVLSLVSIYLHRHGRKGPVHPLSRESSRNISVNFFVL